MQMRYLLPRVVTDVRQHPVSALCDAFGLGDLTGSVTLIKDSGEVRDAEEIE